MTYIAMNSCKNMKQSLKAIINDLRYILCLTFDKKTLIKKSILLI